MADQNPEKSLEEGLVAGSKEQTPPVALKGRQEENHRPYDPLDDEGFNAIGPR